METDLLNPNIAGQKTSHKLKRFVQAPNSYFMDVKCASCGTINVVFSHVKIPVYCVK